MERSAARSIPAMHQWMDVKWFVSSGGASEGGFVGMPVQMTALACVVPWDITCCLYRIQGVTSHSNLPRLATPPMHALTILSAVSQPYCVFCRYADAVGALSSKSQSTSCQWIYGTIVVPAKSLLPASRGCLLLHIAHAAPWRA